jgi:hypothetical protein
LGWLSTAELLVPSQMTSYGIYGGQNDTGEHSSPSFLDLPLVVVISPSLHIYLAPAPEVCESPYHAKKLSHPWSLILEIHLEPVNWLVTVQWIYSVRLTYTTELPKLLRLEVHRTKQTSTLLFILDRLDVDLIT